MIYLINQGVESALAFTIMESVRKGKGLKPEWEEAMKAQDVPDWYIWLLYHNIRRSPVRLSCLHATCNNSTIRRSASYE